jgi:hypothetical protein
MFPKAMGPFKTRSMRLVLLLALMLPLQSFAGVGCSTPHAAVAAHQHCGDPAEGSPANGQVQHHHCGSCCVAAVPAAPIRFTPPSTVNSGSSLPAYWPPLKVAVDRLDRPPRLVAR